MLVNGINNNLRYHSFNFKGETQSKIVTPPLEETKDTLEINKNNIIEEIEGPIIEPLSEYEKELFKRFQNFSMEIVTDVNTCVDVTAESINENDLDNKHSAFLKIAKTPFYEIVQGIAESEEEEKKLKEKLHTSITKNYKRPSNPIEETFNQYMEVVPYITQENSASFVMPMFDELKKMDTENISSKDILDVVKKHVNRQKEEQRAYEEPSMLGKVWNFFFK